MSDTGVTLALRILPQPHVCRAMREAVAEFARSFDIPAGDLEFFQTAVGEALANAIEHSASSEPIELDVSISDDVILAKIRDSGVGFSVDRGTTALPDAASERGRGFPIMRRCSDIFGVESEPGGGTQVVVGRYLRRLAEGAA